MNSVAKGDLKYSAPRLVTYGDMAKLTASGSVGQQENQGTQPSKKA